MNIQPACGCFIVNTLRQRQYLPQVRLSAHASILATTSRTTLTQVFTNPRTTEALEQVHYEFPIYDGVSVVEFTCTIGERVVRGVIRERQQARADFQDAVAQGQTVALFEGSAAAGDVFSTTLGNVPAAATIKVDITYLGELKHDSEVDGLRFTIPTSIAPRYGSRSLTSSDDVALPAGASQAQGKGISITIDAQMGADSVIRSIQSPSHPLDVKIGTLSTSSSDDDDSSHSPSMASASLALKETSLDKDFILHITATNLDTPRAVLETHPTLPNQRAIMATLVPRFNIPAESPEIVFVCDRSGSMWNKISDLIAALNIFLKSLPVGTRFNLCSFGSHYSFMWPESRPYTQATLDEAVAHVSAFQADYGGTEMQEPMRAVFMRRAERQNLEVLLTDGEIWEQEALFSVVEQEVRRSKGAVRVFTLGVGAGVSHSLIEGVARAGNGFSQSVGENEKMDRKVVRMLRASLMPHVHDYSLEIVYDKNSAEDEEKTIAAGDDDDFEIIDKVMDSLEIRTEEDEAAAKSEAATNTEEKPSKPSNVQKFISLFDKSAKEAELPAVQQGAPLPDIVPPRYLQAPSKVPPLFPFSRTTVYVLLSDDAPHRTPKEIKLRGTSGHGELVLDIPITILPEKGTTVHQLAARRAVRELETGRGWLHEAKRHDDKQFKMAYSGPRFADLVKKEGVRLGLMYGVAGQWCSFIAIDDDDGPGQKSKEAPMEVVTSQHQPGPLAAGPYANSTSLFRGGGGPLFGAPTAPGALPPPPMGGAGFTARTRSAAAPTSSVSSAFGAPSPGSVFGSAAFGGSSNEKMKKGLPRPTGHADWFGTTSVSAPAPPPTGGFSFSAAAPSPAALQPAPQQQQESYSLSQTVHFAPPTRPTKLSREEGEAVAMQWFHRLASLQRFDGRWHWTWAVHAELGVKRAQAAWLLKDGYPAGFAARKKEVPKAGEEDEVGDVLATVCVVAAFRKWVPKEEETWGMMVDKAEAWLRATTGVEDVRGLEQAVEGALKQRE